MQKPTVSDQQKYIVSIDGLRTLAVMLVVIFHAGFSGLKGGFIGVDIFFVISGFLITGNIARQLQNDNWSFARFYMRRVARLFPALFVTVAVTLVLAYWILNPDDLSRLGRVSILTVLSSGNIFFWLEAGYFDLSAEFKPLLHTWSLAVEEQFYFIWPLLLFLLFKMGRARSIILGLVCLGILSFIAAWVGSYRMPSAVFFLTPFRGYQFALGGLIALIGVANNTKTTSIAGALSVVVVLALAVLVNGESNHLLAATLPALAAAVIIWASRSDSINLAFSSAPMVWIGQRSYSIYLVHWPLMVLWKMKTDFVFSTLEALTAIVLSIILGAILHGLIEKPFRFHPNFNLSRRSYILAACNALGIAIIVLGAHFWGFSGFPGRVPQEFKTITSNINAKWKLRQKRLRSGVCNILVNVGPNNRTLAENIKIATDFDIETCVTPPKGKKSYLIVGDSFASDAYLVFKDAYPNIYFGQVTIPGCFLKPPARIKLARHRACRDLYQLALTKFPREQKFDGVILGSNWADRHYYIVEEILKLLPKKNLEIVLVGQHIRFTERLPTLVLSATNRADAIRKVQVMMKPGPPRVNKELRKRFSKRVKFFDFIKLQCPDKCDIFTPQKGLMYLDDSHLSPDGAKFLAKRLAKTQPHLLD